MKVLYDRKFRALLRLAYGAFDILDDINFVKENREYF